MQWRYLLLFCRFLKDRKNEQAEVSGASQKAVQSAWWTYPSAAAEGVLAAALAARRHRGGAFVPLGAGCVNGEIGGVQLDFQQAWLAITPPRLRVTGDLAAMTGGCSRKFACAQASGYPSTARARATRARKKIAKERRENIEYKRRREI